MTRVLLSLFSVFLFCSVHAAPVVDIERWHTKNGADVWYSPAPSVPMVDVAVGFSAGSLFDANQPGLAHFVSSMLGEDSGPWSAKVVADRLASVGAKFSTSVNRDNASLHLRSLTEKTYFSSAFNTFVAILSQPRFLPTTVSRIKKQTATALSLRDQSAGDVAADRFFALLYAGMPYAQPVLGTVLGLQHIKEKDLRAFYRKYYVVKNMHIVIVGNVDKKMAHDMAERLAQAMPVGEAVKVSQKKAVAVKGQQVWVPMKKTQTTVLMGQPAVGYGDKNWYPLMVGNYILGGSGMNALLMKSLREKQGLVYGVSSRFKRLALTGPFVLSFKTRQASSRQALLSAQQVLSDFMAQGPSAEALAHAKQALLGSFPLALASNADITEMLLHLALYHLPTDYLDRYKMRVQGVTPEKVKAAFAHTLDLQKMTTVLVGMKAADEK
jgi:zinc protease